MSKSNDTLKLDHAALEHLSDIELNAVTGGSMIGEAIDGVSKAAASAAAGGEGPPLVWVGCAWVPQWW